MVRCQRCGAERVLSVLSHASDRHCVSMNGVELTGYLPFDLGVGGGDDLEIKVCLECGQQQGQFPKPPCRLEDKV